MISDGRPYVLEFNCRFGDPETQAVLPLLEGDFLQALCWSAGISQEPPRLAASGSCAAVVVLASKGYPESYSTGFPISGISKARELPGALVFHGATAWAEIGTGGRGDAPFHPSPDPFGKTDAPEGSLSGRPRLVTSGGRVLNAVGVGDDLRSALRRAYEAASLIEFEGKTLRRDIGHRALSSLKARGI
jgi:phosphoribosylamine--glycine ligase